MNYGNCKKYNKHLKCLKLFYLFSNVFQNVRLFGFVRKYFGIVGVICTINCYFESRIQILCIFLYMGTYFRDIFDTFFENVRNVPEVITIFVRTNCLRSFGILGPKWSPYVAEASLESD